MPSRAEDLDEETARKRVRAWREAAGLTQEQVATKAGTTKAVISNIETGAMGLSWKWIGRIAAALGVPPGLMMDHDPKDAPSTAAMDLAIELTRRMK